MPSHCFSSACACACKNKIRDIEVDDETYGKLKEVLGEIDLEKKQEEKKRKKNQLEQTKKEIIRLKQGIEKLEQELDDDTPQ